MPYIQKHARFTLPDLDNMPADVWEEIGGYLCIVGEEPADYRGSFTACTYSLARSRGEHVPASADYLRDRCTPAPEDIAREIIADYLRFMAYVERMTNPDENAAELLEDVANRIETGKE